MRQRYKVRGLASQPLVPPTLVFIVVVLSSDCVTRRVDVSCREAGAKVRDTQAEKCMYMYSEPAGKKWCHPLS